jgi:hypothetical protein
MVPGKVTGAGPVVDPVLEQDLSPPSLEHDKPETTSDGKLEPEEFNRALRSKLLGNVSIKKWNVDPHDVLKRLYSNKSK